MNPIKEDLRLTRISVPLRFTDISKIKLEELENDFKEDGMEEYEIQKRIDLIKNSSKDKLNAIGIEFTSRELLRQSAEKIYFINFGRTIPDGTISAIPKFLQSRIVWVDQNDKIKNSINNLLEPITDELVTIWDGIRKKNGISEDSPDGHEHGLCLLGEFLTTMAVASKYETEADVNLGIVRQSVNRIKQQVSSSESQAILSRIEGILNCYDINAKIPCINPKTENLPENLLKDLLNDSKIISLSQSRFMFGIPGKFEKAMIMVKQRIKDVLAQPRNKRYLGFAYQIGQIASKKANVDLPEIQSGNTFSSPLIDLGQLKPPCVSIRRELSDSVYF